MDFGYSPRTQELQAQADGASWTSTSTRPRRATPTSCEANTEAGKRWTPLQTIEELKPKARAAGPVEPVPARQRTRRRPVQPGVRAAGRDHGPRAVGERGLQLLGARHRQHGDAGALRLAPSTRSSWLRAAARRRDPQRLRDDRAGGRVVGRHQHRGAHRAPRRRLRDQRPQVVDLGRRRPALQDLHLHGQDRSRRRRGIRSSR